MMVGVNISDEQLGSIADRTIQEADTNGDNSISFNEFIKASFVKHALFTFEALTTSTKVVATEVKFDSCFWKALTICL